MRWGGSWDKPKEIYPSLCLHRHLAGTSWPCSSGLVEFWQWPLMWCTVVIPVWAPMGDHNRISLPLYTFFPAFRCWMLNHWAFIFFSIPDTFSNMSCLTTADLWAHWLVGWKAQRTVVKQRQRLKDWYPALSADLLVILFTESTEILCRFLFFLLPFFFPFFS